MKRPGGFDAGQTDPPRRESPRRPDAVPVEPAIRTVPVASPQPAVLPGGDAPQTPIEVEAALSDGPVDVEPSGGVPAVTEQETVELSDVVGPVRQESEPGWRSRLRLPAVREEDPVRAAAARLRAAERGRRARERQETKRSTAHLRRRRRIWAIAGGAVLALALFAVGGAFTPIMAVRAIEVVGAQRLNADEIAGVLARFDGTPLALVDETEVHRALEPFPLIQRYAIERIPPQTLRLRIEERVPVLAIEREGTFGLVDAAGVLVDAVAEPPSGVPLASGTVVDTAAPAFAAAATIVRDLPEDLRAQLATAEASSAHDVEFVLTGGTRVIWGDAELTQRKAAVLRAMLASIGAVAVIDVSAPETPVFRS